MSTCVIFYFMENQKLIEKLKLNYLYFCYILNK